ncbi:hemerythrin domain-containing protein [Terasakiella sp. SH-1]|uniref:hemerythrin domain-containing protein n=1 Tax=Terasakiella sp. SH-1 TaxID=2560057 RepID=UPI00107306BA|nr:hemerythrin domain-containing protein [Terasakiella sp. SH-1]
MSNLIRILKAEHLNIAQILSEVMLYGAHTPDGRERLIAAKESFLTHLKREDEELYPVLQEAAQNDEKLAETVDLFMKDIQAVSEKALAFFDKYENAAQSHQFEADFTEFLSLLTQRIRNEEQVIYEHYDQLIKS